jgi:hypothetical protein
MPNNIEVAHSTIQGGFKPQGNKQSFAWANGEQGSGARPVLFLDRGYSVR